MEKTQIIGVDLGGTNLRAGIVNEGICESVVAQPLYAQGSRVQILKQIFGVIDKVISPEVKAIGIGVPGLVDPGSRIPYDIVNIPSLNETDLRTVLEQRYQVAVKIENDANCFALGEFHFVAGRSCTSLVGLTIGTGLGVGIIADGKLFTGKHGGAGEFGMIPYGGKNIEYYVSGRFFSNVYQIAGEEAYRRALEGDPEAIKMYADFGRHLGEAIKLIMYVLDTECIIIGGAVKAAFPLYAKSMWATLGDFEFSRSLAALKIETSSLINGNILGAAALYLSTADGRPYSMNNQ
ncbi:ROK family protein [Chitinophaga polysaccharea]|uniref:ROK family protein n=1 Tax=Chitinophaga polysaccharea TaxID=1293035 RepID=UPI0014555497|nr:ROK family protein [Chitinophaga polysaccharea]NLR58194.1 ROK family protein [Chitinophaga polysaccharea]